MRRDPMIPSDCRFLHAFVILIFMSATCFGRADDAEMVKQKLYEAKKAFDGEAKKFQKAVADWLDQREGDARAGGNKKAVDQVKAERAAFEKSGELPTACP